jgi:undecaprenyl diphosphate synthase
MRGHPRAPLPVAILDRILSPRRPASDATSASTAECVAIIMDGNARWARQRGLPTLSGHHAGVKALRRTVEAAPDLGIRTLVVYAFSTENWTRPDEEVSGLMDLFARTIQREFMDLHRQGVRIRFIGRRDRVSSRIRALMDDIETRTRVNERLELVVAFDYGGRAEIVDACRRIVEDGLRPDEIDETAIRSRLAAGELPDPDLVIRTSGEQRVSNFLLWHAAYAEYAFPETLWPDFGADQLREAVGEFATRRRRFGGR